MKWFVGTGPAAGFGLAFAALLIDAALGHWGTTTLHQSGQRLAQQYAVLAELEGALSLLKDAETGQRGYLITGEAPYLEPYHDASGQVQQRLERLEELTADHPAQQEQLAVLREKVARKFQQLQRGIVRRDEQGFEAARRLVLTGQGKVAMDEVRETVDAMIRREQALLGQRREEARRSFRTAWAAGLAALGLTAAVVGAAFQLVRRELRARGQAEADLARALEGTEAQVRERTAELTVANEALRRSNRELEEFAYVASHDLQEPLRKIQAFGERLQSRCRDQLAEQGREYLERMHSSAARMQRLINDLLTFSRVTTRGQPFAPVDLAAVAQDVVSDLEDRVQQTGGRVEVGALPTVEGDPTQLRQLLQNLVANGLKFHRPGEPPVVSVEARVLPPAGEDGPPRCELVVSDNGIGFEEKYLDRIFQVFQRLHGRSEYEGTGVGLAICRKIAERHGGAITARSTPGQGSTFVVTLPLQQRSA